MITPHTTFYDTLVAIDPNLIHEEDFRLAQIRHRIFTGSNYVRDVIARDDEFMARIASVKKQFGDIEAEAVRLLAEAVKTPSAGAITAAALKRATVQIGKQAMEGAEALIRRERYVWLEETAEKRKAVLVDLWSKVIAEVKKSPKTEYAQIHVLRIRQIDAATGRIELLKGGYTLRPNVGNYDHSDPQNLRSHFIPPALQKYTPPSSPGSGRSFEYEEPAAARESRENRDAARAREESKKHGFVSAYIAQTKF